MMGDDLMKCLKFSEGIGRKTKPLSDSRKKPRSAFPKLSNIQGHTILTADRNNNHKITITH